MDRRALERWSTALGGFVLAGTFFFYVQVWVAPRSYSGDLERWLRRVVDGTADAPYQYRVLVPTTLVWLTDHAHLSIAQATIVVDGSALAIGTALGFRLLRQSGLAVYALPAALYAGYLGVGLLFYPKPETFMSFAVLAAAVLVVARETDANHPWLLLGVAATVLTGCRTDLLVALGAGFGARSWQRRRLADAVAAVGLVAVAVAATIALRARYPDATYPEGVGIVQLQHNFKPLPLVIAASFLLPAFGPFAFARDATIRPAVLKVGRQYGPLLAVIAAEVAVTLVVGRIDEVRLLFPLAFPIGLVGIELWRAVIRSVEWGNAPVA